MEVPTESAYIIVGGGLTGCALAGRLAERLGPSSSILILEAGVDFTSNRNSTSLGGGFTLPGSELDWAYKTAPNPALDNRVITLVAGKTLGGGSVLNYGGWARGDKRDYNAWARIVDDNRGSYKGLLPYFKRSESVHDAAANPDQYGSHGPMKVTSISASDPKRRYPLREPILKAWAEIGVEKIPTNTSKLDGLSEFLENFDDGIRQPSHFGLRPTWYQNPRATTVVLADGRHIKARKEIIISAGAVGSPQLLQLPEVGPASALNHHSIPVVFDLPAVGQNLFEHFASFQIIKLRNPVCGLSLGNPSLSDPAFFKGMPVDWGVNEALPAEMLQKALADDGDLSDVERLGEIGRNHVETMILYNPLAPDVTVYGSFVGTSVMLPLPKSRGSLELASASPNGPPVIAGNCFSTATDCAVIVYGARRLLQCLTGTEIGKEFVETEVGPGQGLEPLTVEISDKDIEDRVRIVGNPHFYIAGTCAIGKVLDTNLRVKGIQGLRVVDASISRHH
ncbi:523bad2d-82f2-447d-83ee-838763d562f7 [Sclerotinia trifoliorum]|uniref:523bad2d-82f2-447d-83ee-838763d562f7 n=1 Tax=Sclerotinia trifoliorum TaxID=28548 RepID=A0A8H2W7D0_9HELO|nr:523bad2d-82f2-447d-83ee-838763d562f7 [Sclerotinia trifoliorum]